LETDKQTGDWGHINQFNPNLSQDLISNVKCYGHFLWPLS